MVATKGPGFQPVDGIAPIRAPLSLLSVARKIPDTVEWRSGVAWRQSPVCAAGGVGPGYRLIYCAGTAVTLASPAAIAEPEFYPFDIYVPYACDWVPAGTEGPYNADARAALEAVTPWHIARELWAGATEAANPTLQSTAVDVSAASAVHPVNGVGKLLQAWSDCTQQGGDGERGPIIHVPYSALPGLYSQGVAKEVDGRIHGPAGSLISPGPGYPDGGTSGPSAAAAGTGNVWMYITGPIEYGAGPIAVNPDNDMAHHNARANRYEVTARRQAIYRFDPCCVQAVKVYVPAPANS